MQGSPVLVFVFEHERESKQADARIVNAFIHTQQCSFPPSPIYLTPFWFSNPAWIAAKCSFYAKQVARAR